MPSSNVLILQVPRRVAESDPQVLAAPAEGARVPVPAGHRHHPLRPQAREYPAAVSTAWALTACFIYHISS